MIFRVREEKHYREYQRYREKNGLNDRMSARVLEFSHLNNHIEIAKDEKHHLYIENYPRIEKVG